MRILRTERLVMRPVESSDGITAFAILGCYETMRGRSFAKDTLKDAEAWLANRVADWDRDGYGWWMIQAEGHSGVGLCGFFARGEELELGYVIKASFQRRGYGREAVRIALDFAQRGGRGVYATIRPSNKRSVRLAERCGLKRMPTRLASEPELDLYRSFWP